MTEGEKQELVSVRRAAQACGRNAETVRRWIWSGRLPAEKLGNQLFIKRRDLESYCRETAVAYRVEPEESLSEIGEAGNDLSQLENEEMNIERAKDFKYSAGIKPGSKKLLIIQLRNLREDIRASLGGLNAAEELENVRSGRADELPRLY